MSFKIASWNIETRLSERGIKGRGSVSNILNEIDALNADVVILPEAFDDVVGKSKMANQFLWEMYPFVKDVDYAEADTYEFAVAQKPVFRIMSRLAIVWSDVIRPGKKRQLPVLTVTDPATQDDVTIFATHLDDKQRTERLDQIDSLAAIMKQINNPIIMMGDFNASTGKSVGARLFRTPGLERLTHLIPERGREIRNIAQRAIAMSSGDELRELEAKTGLVNADPSGKATTTPKLMGAAERLPAVRFFDIDHLYTSPSLHVKNFTVMDHDGGSDHRAISATISL
jgi:endonuclease/exonuclease/phosphatase family metal-dependent hydrolase